MKPSAAMPWHIAAFAALAAGLLAGCSEQTWEPPAPAPPAPPGIRATVAIHTASGTRTVSGPLRVTDGERHVGLMHRKERLRDTECMLFAMDDDRDHSFWMQNTWIPLDMVFISREGSIVGILRDVPPRTTDSRRTGKVSRYVLELDGGWCGRMGAGVGDRVELRLERE